VPAAQLAGAFSSLQRLTIFNLRLEPALLCSASNEIRFYLVGYTYKKAVK